MFDVIIPQFLEYELMVAYAEVVEPYFVNKLYPSQGSQFT